MFPGLACSSLKKESLRRKSLTRMSRIQTSHVEFRMSPHRTNIRRLDRWPSEVQDCKSVSQYSMKWVAGQLRNCRPVLQALEKQATVSIDDYHKVASMPLGYIPPHFSHYRDSFVGWLKLTAYLSYWSAASSSISTTNKSSQNSVK